MIAEFRRELTKDAYETEFQADCYRRARMTRNGRTKLRTYSR